MKRIEIEAMARLAIERAIRRQPVEDMRVELKSKWPDAKDAARQIGAICNAALGDPVLWLIGVDEKLATVVGAEAMEVATWWSVAKSCFDGTPPLLHHLMIESGGKPVVALLFLTDLAPFVVKNPAGGQISREVPWREGTRTDSASREQLVLILAPLARVPAMEVVSANLELKVSPGNGGRVHEVRWRLEAEIYLTQRQEQQSSLASHKTFVDVHYGDDLVAELGNVAFQLPATTTGSYYSALSIQGPGYFRVRANKETKIPSRLEFPDDQIAFGIAFDVPNCPREVSLTHDVVAVSMFRGQPQLNAGIYEKVWSFPNEVLFRKRKVSLAKLNEDILRS